MTDRVKAALEGNQSAGPKKQKNDGVEASAVTTQAKDTKNRDNETLALSLIDLELDSDGFYTPGTGNKDKGNPVDDPIMVNDTEMTSETTEETAEEELGSCLKYQ